MDNIDRGQPELRPDPCKIAGRVFVFEASDQAAIAALALIKQKVQPRPFTLNDAAMPRTQHSTKRLAPDMAALNLRASPFAAEGIEMNGRWTHPDTQCRMLSHARLHVRTRDAAPAILFVHGGFHGAWCWTNVTEYLAENGLTCAALDLRGHGGLPQDHSFITDGVAAMVSDVREAAALLPRPLFLAGHSLGALIVLQAAAPISPDGLILLSPAAPAGVPRMHKLPRFPTDRAVAPPPQERARKWFMSGSASPLDEYLPRLCPESPTLLNECLHDGIEVALEADRWPALCISGGKDDSPLHPGGQDQAIAAWLGTSVHVISQSGHCLMLDDGWRETAATIQSWVKART